MKTLLRFSLKRRFFNKVSILLQFLFTLLVFGGFFADKISSVLNLKLDEPYSVDIVLSEGQTLLNEDAWISQGFQLRREAAEIVIRPIDGGFSVSGANNAILRIKIQQLLLGQHQLKLLSESPQSVNEWLGNYERIEVNFTDAGNDDQTIKTQLIVVFLTSLYFMMLNFIAVNSNEIITEKTSHILPLLLSSVTSVEHFFAKLISGMVQVVYQIVSSILIFGLAGFSRYRLDRGRGLYLILTKYLPLPSENAGFDTILKMLDFGWEDIGKILIGILFLIVGILLVQILILVLSSRVRTAEEAASIQGPFYLILLILYYGSLSLNSPDQLSKGLGYTLSFVPVMSMLIMPMRLLSTEVLAVDVMLSLMFTGISIVSVIVIGFPIYRKGLVNER